MKKTLRAAVLVGCLLTACAAATAQQQKVPPQAPATNSAAVRKPEQEIAYQGRERAWLGVTLSEDNKGHVWIHSVIAGSPADWAHLRPHDQIVAMDETPIHCYADAVRFINSKRPDEEITVAIKRDGVPGGGFTAVLGSARRAPPGAPARAGTGANTAEAIPGQPGLPEQIVYQGREQARLGVTLSEDNKGHVWIRSVIAGSPADWALLRPATRSWPWTRRPFTATRMPCGLSTASSPTRKSPWRSSATASPAV